MDLCQGNSVQRSKMRKSRICGLAPLEGVNGGTEWGKEEGEVRPDAELESCGTLAARREAFKNKKESVKAGV